MNTLCRSAATVLLCLGLKVASIEITVEPGGETIQVGAMVLCGIMVSSCFLGVTINTYMYAVVAVSSWGVCQ